MATEAHREAAARRGARGGPGARPGRTKRAGGGGGAGGGGAAHHQRPPAGAWRDEGAAQRSEEGAGAGRAGRARAARAPPAGGGRGAAAGARAGRPRNGAAGAGAGAARECDGGPGHLFAGRFLDAEEEEEDCEQLCVVTVDDMRLVSLAKLEQVIARQPTLVRPRAACKVRIDERDAPALLHDDLTGVCIWQAREDGTFTRLRWIPLDGHRGLVDMHATRDGALVAALPVVGPAVITRVDSTSKCTATVATNWWCATWVTPPSTGAAHTHQLVAATSSRAGGGWSVLALTAHLRAARQLRIRRR